MIATTPMAPKEFQVFFGLTELVTIAAAFCKFALTAA